MDIIRRPRAVIKGDRQTGVKHLKQAENQMTIMEGLMDFQGLDQYAMQRELYPGVVVKCEKVFGEKTITITTLGGGDAEQPKYKECLCTCNLTVGWVVEQQPLDLDAYIPTYTVAVCQGRKRFEVFYDVLASDFTRYEAGQGVVLMPYYQMEYLCTTPDLMVPPSATGCAALHTEELIESDNWRTSFRIVPLCGIGLTKWKETSGG